MTRHWHRVICKPLKARPAGVVRGKYGGKGYFSLEVAGAKFPTPNPRYDPTKADGRRSNPPSKKPKAHKLYP